MGLELVNTNSPSGIMAKRDSVQDLQDEVVDNTIIEKSDESVRKTRRPLGKKNLFSELD